VVGIARSYLLVQHNNGKGGWLYYCHNQQPMPHIFGMKMKSFSIKASFMHVLNKSTHPRTIKTDHLMQRHLVDVFMTIGCRKYIMGAFLVDIAANTCMWRDQSDNMRLKSIHDLTWIKIQSYG
jgi:hypothetical protein